VPFQQRDTVVVYTSYTVVLRPVDTRLERSLRDVQIGRSGI
jgi:hypothetical protein